jgi:hypothetical protein
MLDHRGRDGYARRVHRMEDIEEGGVHPPKPMVYREYYLVLSEGLTLKALVPGFFELFLEYADEGVNFPSLVGVPWIWATFTSLWVEGSFRNARDERYSPAST